MANNVTITQGTGTDIATDQVGVIHYQKIKLVDGTEEGDTPAVVDVSGNLMVKPNGGTVSVVSNITNGSVVVTTGTVAGGSIVVTNGTIASIPNIPGGTLGVVSNLTNGSIVVTNGTIGGGSIVMTVGTISSLPNISQGSIQVTAGTITAGTLTNLASGTINSATVSGNLGTISAITNLVSGTINSATVSGNLGTLSMISAGTITSVGSVPGIGILSAGTISMINAGTITSVGTVPGIGVVTALTNGTIGAGTVAVSAGTVIMTAGTIAAGTQNTLGTVGVVSMLTAGTITALANGTIGAGTIAVSAGTITHGTIDNGTVKLDGRPARNVLTYGTTFVGTEAAYGTLVGSAVVGAGTSIWMNDVSIVNAGGTLTSLVGFGTALNGTSIIVKGNFGPQGGIEKKFPLAVNAGMTNQDLICYVAGAGTIDVNVSYFISA